MTTYFAFHAKHLHLLHEQHLGIHILYNLADEEKIV